MKKIAILALSLALIPISYGVAGNGNGIPPGVNPFEYLLEISVSR